MSLLAELREATRATHDRLELSLDVPARCRTRDGYAALLLALRAVHAPVEAALACSPVVDHALPDWRSRRKTAWLDADLRDLGVVRPTAPVEVAPLSSVEDVLGTAYVVEGATLGGALVVRQLHADHDDPPPHRFFSSYGAQRGARWRAFRERADALDGLDAARVVTAAHRTFGLFAGRCDLAATR